MASIDTTLGFMRFMYIAPATESDYLASNSANSDLTVHQKTREYFVSR